MDLLRHFTFSAVIQQLKPTFGKSLLYLLLVLLLYNLNFLLEQTQDYGFMGMICFVSFIAFISILVILEDILIRVAIYYGPILPYPFWLRLFCKLCNTCYKYFYGMFEINLFYYNNNGLIFFEDHVYSLRPTHTLLTHFCKVCYAYGHQTSKHYNSYLNETAISIANLCKMWNYHQLKWKFVPASHQISFNNINLFEEDSIAWLHHCNNFQQENFEHFDIWKFRRKYHHIGFVPSAFALVPYHHVQLRGNFQETTIGEVFMNDDIEIPHYGLLQYEDGEDLLARLRVLASIDIQNLTIYGCPYAKELIQDSNLTGLSVIGYSLKFPKSDIIKTHGNPVKIVKSIN